MSSKPDHNGLQEAACGALQSLASLHGTATLVLQQGGVEAIVKAIHTSNQCHE